MSLVAFRGPHVEIERSVRRQIPSGAGRLLRRRLRRAAFSMGVQREALEELNVKLCDAKTMIGLNREFRGVAASTDVLSFPSERYDGRGDLALDWGYVVRQAHCYGRVPVDEASLLLVHGLAHLLGHDHAGRAEGRRMLRWERRGLRSVGIADGWRPYAGGA